MSRTPVCTREHPVFPLRWVHYQKIRLENSYLRFSLNLWRRRMEFDLRLFGWRNIHWFRRNIGRCWRDVGFGFFNLWFWHKLFRRRYKLWSIRFYDRFFNFGFHNFLRFRFRFGWLYNFLFYNLRFWFRWQFEWRYWIFFPRFLLLRLILMLRFLSQLNFDRLFRGLKNFRRSWDKLS